MRINNRKILIILSIILLSITGCSVYNSVNKKDVQEYLEDKYGEDEGFYFVEKGYCNLFEVGTCSYYYSSKKLEKDEKFLVEWTDGRGKNMYDDYINAKYQPKLEEHYDNLLAPVLDFDYKITAVSTYYDFEAGITFKNYLHAKNLDANITIDTKEQNLDIKKISNDVKNIIEKNEINNIKCITIDQFSSNGIFEESYEIFKK